MLLGQTTVLSRNLLCGCLFDVLEEACFLRGCLLTSLVPSFLMALKNTDTDKNNIYIVENYIILQIAQIRGFYCVN